MGDKNSVSDTTGDFPAKGNEMVVNSIGEASLIDGTGKTISLPDHRAVQAVEAVLLRQETKGDIPGEFLYQR